MKRPRLVRKSLQYGALGMLTAVMLGAFGAHGLQALLPEKVLNTYQTAVQYQIYHSLGLLVIGAISQRQDSPLLVFSYRCFGWGILIFSGSLYLLVASTLFMVEPQAWLGAITPIGGSLFIAGWISFIWRLFDLKK